MKKTIAILLILTLALGTAACGAAPEKKEGFAVVATLFPQYDFARNVAGGLADIALLLPPGVESHSYEPTPADMVSINEADLFLYTGEYMEPWAAQIIDSLPDSVRVVDVSQGVSLREEAEHEEDHEGHAHGLDPHIWTDPQNAQTMTQNIMEAFCAADPDNAAAYKQNGEAYCEKLVKLDRDMQAMVAGAVRREVCFAGRFAMRYFAQRYGLTVVAAYDSCSAETEPSAKALAEITDRITQDGIPAVYYEELVDPHVARSICEETGAQMLLLHSCHNLSKEERGAGADYLSLMYQNLENLKAGLY